MKKSSSLHSFFTTDKQNDSRKSSKSLLTLSLSLSLLNEEILNKKLSTNNNNNIIYDIVEKTNKDLIKFYGSHQRFFQAQIYKNILNTELPLQIEIDLNKDLVGILEIMHKEYTYYFGQTNLCTLAVEKKLKFTKTKLNNF